MGRRTDRMLCTMADDVILEIRGPTREFKGFPAVKNADRRVRRVIVGEPAAWRAMRRG